MPAAAPTLLSRVVSIHFSTSASFARVNNYGIAYNHNSGNTYGVITHTLILNSFAYG
jgi:hypothetical protein